MWRPAHGATKRPGPSRPASGYGQVVGRPGPRLSGPIAHDRHSSWPDPSAFVASLLVPEPDAERPAPATP
jgi:hypothetical protein